MSQGNVDSHELGKPMTPTQVVASRVEQVRTAHGWSTTDLAERMEALGYKWDRFTVRNLERGRRQKIALDEVFALAYVLDVSPINLITPVDDETRRTYEVVPSMTVTPLLVREWIRSTAVLPGQDKRHFFAQASKVEMEMRDQLVAQMTEGGISEEFKENLRQDHAAGRFLPIVSAYAGGVMLFTSPSEPLPDQAADDGER